MCNLNIKYTGSGPFEYCVNYSADPHTDNSTKATISMLNNDTVCDSWQPNGELTFNQIQLLKFNFFLSFFLESNEIDFQRFFQSVQNITIMMLIKNRVSIAKTPIGVQFIQGEIEENQEQSLN